MSHQVHPYPTFVSNYDSEKNRWIYEQSAYAPGITVRQLYLVHILAAIASNPATMLDPETHVDYAVKLATLAYEKMPG